MKKEEKTIEETYQKKSQLEHILLRPDSYIGSVEIQKDKLWVFNKQTETLVFREIKYVPGLFKIFDEIIVNAADNFQRDKKQSYIKIWIDQENNRISVQNDGKGIPVKIHGEYNIYVPELIFGNLLTSSNYNDNEKKVVGGRNGYGAKLTNIFSKVFIVETADGSSGKCFKQIFKNNMSIKSNAEIKNYDKPDYTKITFEPDLSKFQMSQLDDDIVSLMIKRVYDLAGTTNDRVKVYLNDKKLELKNFNNYIDMFMLAAESESAKVYERINEHWEVGVCISDGQFQQVSYVNAICTSKGGTHVNFIADQIIDAVKEIIEKKEKKITIKPHQIKQHLWIFVNCLVVNPSFDSQTKENLTLKSSSFGTTGDDPQNFLNGKFLKEILKLPIVEHALSFVKAKEDLKVQKALSAGNKKATRLFGIPKLEDANNAGSKTSENCTLILTEGDSAKSLAMAGIEVVGRDNFGVFPLKGKLLNVRDASNSALMNNDEIQNLIKIIGLSVGKQYQDNKSLRYGSIMIMTDQDTDGSHIKGLIINFIHKFWPSLIQINGFLKEFITPILKATKGNTVKSFYTIPEYKQWVDEIGGSVKGWKVKYYKGLGTSTDKEAKEYFKNYAKSKINFEYIDNNDDDHIDLVFNKKKAEDRKKWLSDFDYRNALQDSNIDKIRYMDFINKEFVLFSIADNERSIPSICDGLKPSERKIIFSCFKRKLKDEIKVAQLAGYVSEHSAYHHGEMSLTGTIVAMAQNFVGSNNINLLMPNGQFGTRNMGGKDHASSRYIFTNLNRVSRQLFNENDDPLMDYIVEEGQKIEPHWYLPIIPLLLVNGAEGIGTGWSTSIPCHCPREIVESIKQKMNTGQFHELTPFYKGYQGTIERNDKGSYNVMGKYEFKPDERLLIITELPVKVWTKKYKTFLEEKLMGIQSKKEKKDKKDNEKNTKGKKKNVEEDDTKEEIIIEDLREYHTNNRVHFEIKIKEEYIKEFEEDEAHIIKTFKLASTISTSNLVCYNSERKIKRYSNTIEILEEFFNVRLQFYEMRKEYLISIITRDLEILDNKARFILAVVDEVIIVRKVKRNDLIKVLYEMKFTPMSKINMIAKSYSSSKETEILEVKENNNEEEEEKENEGNSKSIVPYKEYDYLVGMPLWSLTYERVQEIQNQRENKSQELKKLKETPIKEIWNKDLDNFLEVLDEVERIEEEERIASVVEGEKGGKKKRRQNKKNDNVEDEKKKKNEKTEKTEKPIKNEKKEKNEKNEKDEKLINDKKETKDQLLVKTSLMDRIGKKNDNVKIDNYLKSSQDSNLHEKMHKRKIVEDDEIGTKKTK